jgi:hypothetical protein
MRRGAQDLGRARAEQHVFRLHAVAARQQLGHFVDAGGLVAADLTEACAHGLEHRLRRAERVLVAREDNGSAVLRKGRFGQVEETGLTPASRDPQAGRARAHSLNESTSRQRHG